MEGFDAFCGLAHGRLQFRRHRSFGVGEFFHAYFEASQRNSIEACSDLAQRRIAVFAHFIEQRSHRISGGGRDLLQRYDITQRAQLVSDDVRHAGFVPCGLINIDQLSSKRDEI